VNLAEGAAVLSMARDVTVGDPIAVGPLTLFPLFSPITSSLTYLTCAAATGSGLLECDELNPPDLSAVIATNLAVAPVLIPSGTLIFGGAQSRVVSTGILCPPRAVVMVSVAGVDPGRWGPFGPLSPTDRSAPGSVRAALADSVRAGGPDPHLSQADQEAVWLACASILESTSSHGGDLCDSIEQRASLLMSNLEHLEAQDGQTGLVCIVGDHVAGMDIFDRPAALARHLPGILIGHALDSSWNAISIDEMEARDVATESVYRFLDLVDNASTSLLPGGGMADGFRLDGAVVGAGLRYEDEFVHLAAFSSPPAGGR
jgi:hypothetical protein